MKKFYFSFILCFIFSIQFSFAQKLEKIYDSPILSKTNNSNIRVYGASFYQKNGNINLTKVGCVIQYSDKKTNSLVFDFIHYDGRKIRDKKVIKSDIDKEFSDDNNYIADSSRLILLNYTNGLFNILIYDINTGSLIQTIKTKIELGDLFSKNIDKNRTEEYKVFAKNKNHQIGGGQLYGNMLLIKIYTQYFIDLPIACTPCWIDLTNPENINLIFPDFPKLNDDEHKVRLQIWDYERYDSGMFIYTRKYFIDKGSNIACTIAEFDNQGKLIRSIDVNLTLDGYNTFHTFKHYLSAAEVKYNPQEKAFYLVSSLISDKKINGNTYGMVLKKFDPSGKNIWEKMYFDKELFKYEDWTEANLADVNVFKSPTLKLSPMNQTFSIGLGHALSKIDGITFNSINGEFISKQKTTYQIFDTEYLDIKLEEQIKDVMDVNKYKVKIPLFYEYGKNILVLFQDANGGYAVYKWQ